MDAKSTRSAKGPDSMKRGRVPGCPRRPHSPCFTVPREPASHPVARRTSPVAQQRCQDVVRGRFEEAAGRWFRVVARRSVTVMKGRRGKRSRDGTPREAVDHGTTAGRARMRRAQRAPRSTFGLGRACPVHRAFFSSAPRPALARRAFNHSPSPRGLFTPALDVRSSSKPRWLQFQAVTPCSNDTLAAGAELRTTRTGLPGSALRRRARARGACPGRRRSARSRRAARRGRGAPPSRSRRPIRRCASGRPSRG